ncbi:protein NIM1-INTERACTING 1-like [Camellia sinensis]|uniref:protein NIM1-INTERACTING 1-like n=1 Tax=Camellia sinensis TaxID=4442 RepID=UPI0010366E37|nr:protein NIM1-INTERACTING 1-like [Camellia sinensis]
MSKNNNMEIGRINDDRREAAEEEDVDEEKMDKFFALIRNFRDARDRRRNELKQLQIRNNNNNNNNNENLKKRKADQDHHRRQEQSRSWVPSFEWEDFNDHRKTLIFSNPNPNPINSNHQQQQQQRKNEDQQCDETGLDLKLTL